MKRKKFQKSVVIKGGFKCDNLGCDYREEKPQDFEYLDEFEDYVASYLSKNCPKCGAPLLTEEDYRITMWTIRMVHHPLLVFLNKLGDLFGSKKTRIEMKMNGTGDVQFTDLGRV
jgi:hypothetical protein